MKNNFLTQMTRCRDTQIVQKAPNLVTSLGLEFLMNPEVAYPSYKPRSLPCSNAFRRQIMELLRIIESHKDCGTLESLVSKSI